MGKTGRWIRSFFTGKKDSKEADSQPTPATHKEKRRWSFRSSPAPGREGRGSMDLTAATSLDHVMENEARKHALAVADLAVATAAAADAAVAAAKAAAAVIQMTAAAASSSRRCNMESEEAAAVKIQSVFRAYLARKALNALRGLVKLQALVRGHLVRKQATATLRCMQALIAVQARARAQRLQMAASDPKTPNSRKSTQENRFRYSNQDYERSLEENIKIVEMDLGGYSKASTPTKARNSYSNHTQAERKEQRITVHRTSIKQENHQSSPAPSTTADYSPRTSSNHFEEFSFRTVQSSPQCYSAMSKPETSRIPFSYARSEYGGESFCDEFPFFPNYMANTESSRAKVRSHSAPKTRPADAFEGQPSRRRPSLEGRLFPRVVRMQRSSSQIGSTAQNYQYPATVKLEKSFASLMESEYGSTSTHRSGAGFEESNRFNLRRLI